MSGSGWEESGILIVTGLPRSGTSMMMQMLAAGGCGVVTDGVRGADASNPWGYLEYEAVKRLPFDSSWLPLARGRALKVVAPLLPYLPLREPSGAAYDYRVILMQRDWAEVADSQSRMLQALGREEHQQPEALLRAGMLQHAGAARRWLAQHDIATLEVDYCEAMASPVEAAMRVAKHIPGFDVAAGAAAVVRKAARAALRD